MAEREPIPAVENAGMLQVALALLGVLALVVGLGLPLVSPSFAHAAGLRSVQDATITEVERRDGDSGFFIRGVYDSAECPRWEVRVDTADRPGRYWECEAWGFPEPRPGDDVRVVGAVFSSHMITERGLDEHGWTAEAVVLAAVLLVAWWVLARALVIRRLRKGAARGVRYVGSVVKVGAMSMSSRVRALDADGGEERRFWSVPEKKTLTAVVGDSVRVWGSRGSRLTGRPKGPWVVSERGRPAEVHLAGWLRRS